MGEAPLEPTTFLLEGGSLFAGLRLIFSPQGDRAALKSSREGISVTSSGVLAMDLGGTNLRMAYLTFAQATNTWTMQHRLSVSTADYTNLKDAALFWCKQTGAKPTALGLGVAGPVVARRAKITNLTWSVDAAAIENALQLPVTLINDLEAHGYGIVATRPKGHQTWRPGVEVPATNAAVIAPGTGLGEAILFFDGRGFVPSASEGGHTGFAPGTEEEDALLVYLRKQHHHVSWERVVSGRDGFRNIYEFLRDTERVNISAKVRARLDGRTDIGAELIALAGEGDAVGLAVLERFAHLLGVEAGNLALKALATAGLYVAGRLPSRVFAHVSPEIMAKAFEAKGRFRELLRQIPIYRADDPDLGLLGAGVAAYLAGQRAI